MGVTFDIDKDQNITFCISDELNLPNAGKIKKEILTCMSENIYKDIYFDLSTLSYIDSSGLGLLFHFDKQMKNENKKLYIKSPTEDILKVIKLGSFDKVLNIVD